VKTEHLSPDESGAPVLLTARDLEFGYAGRPLLPPVSFDIVRGQILGIVGPNGCGKTTLLRTMLGLMPPLGGRVERERPLRYAYLPQRDRLEMILPLTVRDIVLMGRRARFGALHRDDDADRDAARRALGRVGIEHLADRLFRQLSTGQQQRTMLARALAVEPDVLVLDEPTAGMDIASEAAMLGFLHDLRTSDSVTILVVTHVLAVVLNLATHMMLLDRGTFLNGRIDDVVRVDRLEALYGVPVHVGAVDGQRVVVVGQPGGSGV
jgi:zinc transport system ATP-binding protein